MLKKKIQLIHEQGNDFVIGVKANQKRLHQQLRELGWGHQDSSVDLSCEQTRGRKTKRLAAVFELPDSLKQRWQGAQMGVSVVRWGTRQGNPYCEQRYYITRWRERTETLQARIRAH
ncbi:MAG: hypothetical protein Kow00121_09830 [Elainellaceae cyanobacterium]